MVHNQTTKFRNSAAQFFLGNVALASVSAAFRRPRLDRLQTRRTTKPNLPQRRPKPPTIAHYAMAVLSVAVAIIVAELITRLLQAEPIASSMLCAVIFAAWFGGFGPAVLGPPLPLFAFPFFFCSPLHLLSSSLYLF